MAKGDAINEEQARLALLSLANGGRIGRIAKYLGLHHQTLKRLLIEFDAKAFEAVYAPKPKPEPKPVAASYSASPLPSREKTEESELALIRKELRAGLTIRDVAKRRNKRVQDIIALLPQDLQDEVDPKKHAENQERKRGLCLEILRLLQMDLETEVIRARLPEATAEQIEGLKQLCQDDTLGSRWALKEIGPFFCFSGRSGPLQVGKKMMPSVLVRCRCGHEQWKSTAALSIGIARCEKCGLKR